MKLLDTLTLSTRMFTTRPLRTFLTVLGVGVGIGAVLFLVSLGYGLQNLILSQITTADSLLSLDVRSGSSQLVTITQQDVDEILEMEQVAEVSPSASFASQVSLGGLTSNSRVRAVDPAFFRLSGILPEKGEMFEYDDVHKAVISSAGAKLFNMTPEEIIGEKISFSLFLTQKDEDGFEEIKVEKRNEEYEIVGVVTDPNNNYLFIPLGTLIDLQINEYEMLKVKVANDQVMEDVRENIITKGFLVSSLSDTIDQAKKIFQIVQIILALFGLIALSVSAIGMFNTMTVSLLERINEIGIMRAIGVTTSDIRRMFMVESILMGLLGGVAGVILGFAGAYLVNFGINVLAARFGGQAMNLFYQPPWFVIFILVFSSVVGFITGIYPSIKASRINPLNALRYK